MHAHESEEGAEPTDHAREITALLIRYRSAMAAVVLPVLVSATPDLQPAVPALEVARLVKLLGVSSSILRWLGIVLLALASAGFVVALFTALSHRRRELALLRAVGASRRLLVTLIALEGVVLGALGRIAGCLSEPGSDRAGGTCWPRYAVRRTRRSRTGRRRARRSRHGCRARTARLAAGRLACRKTRSRARAGARLSERAGRIDRPVYQRSAL